MPEPARIVLVDPGDDSRAEMTRSLTEQGYAVESFADAALGAEAALAAPPCAMIADLWMPSVSGVQLCRLMRAEPGTATMPVILRGDDDPRGRFWAERAGAAAYVVKSRLPELLSVLADAADAQATSDGFFLQLSGGSLDIHHRIARHLDVALFDSVIAAEVRALATAGSFPRLFELLTEFLSQVIGYRWLAVYARESSQFALHHRPDASTHTEVEARIALKVPSCIEALRVQDHDARAPDPAAPAPLIVCNVPFGCQLLGRIAIAPVGDSDSRALLEQVARELGGPLRMAMLMDETQKLATTDPLTGLANRRALLDKLHIEIAHAGRHNLPLSVCLLDVDHFKSINDTYGHAAGDHVLSAIGALLPHQLRIPDVPARWGGEEFVLLLKQTDGQGALIAAERIRRAITELHFDAHGRPVAISASFGIAEFTSGDSAESLIARADKAMYRAKVGGRNRVELEPLPEEKPQPSRIRTTGAPPSSKSMASQFPAD